MSCALPYLLYKGSACPTERYHKFPSSFVPLSHPQRYLFRLTHTFHLKFFGFPDHNDLVLCRTRLFCYQRTSPLLSRHRISRSRHIHSAAMARKCWHRGRTQRACVKYTCDRLLILLAERYSCHHCIQERPRIQAQLERSSRERGWIVGPARHVSVDIGDDYTQRFGRK